MKSTKKIIAIDKLHAFENHPYKVQDNEEMEALAESIKEHGIDLPLLSDHLKTLQMNMKSYPVTDGLWQAKRQGFQKSLP